MKEYIRRILPFLVRVTEKIWIWFKVVLLSLFKLFIRWDTNKKTLSIIESVVTIVGGFSIIYMIIMPVYYNYNPPIDLIFSPNETVIRGNVEYAQIEVYNDYKTLKNVEGKLDINCKGAKYNKSLSFKFLENAKILPEKSSKFLISTDEQFLKLVKNSNHTSCAQSVYYVGKYFNENMGRDGKPFTLVGIDIYEIIMDENVKVEKAQPRCMDNLNPNVYLCTSCDIYIELTAENLRKPIKKHEKFVYTTGESQFNFINITNPYPDDVSNTIYQGYIHFPFGMTYCYNLTIEDCTKFLCKEIKKQYPSAALECEPKYINCAGLNSSFGELQTVSYI